MMSGEWQHTMDVLPYRRVEMWRVRPLVMGGWSWMIGVTSFVQNEVLIALDDVEKVGSADGPPTGVEGHFVWRYLP